MKPPKLSCRFHFCIEMNWGSSGASGGSLRGGAGFKVEKAHFAA